jgi:hypothetical protein
MPLISTASCLKRVPLGNRRDVRLSSLTPSLVSSCWMRCLRYEPKTPLRAFSRGADPHGVACRPPPPDNARFCPLQLRTPAPRVWRDLHGAGVRKANSSGHNRNLFDDLVGAGVDGTRDVEAKRLGSLEIDHQLILDWILQSGRRRQGASA